MPQPAERFSRRSRLPVVLDQRDRAPQAWLQMVRTFTRIQRRLEQVLDRHALTLPQFDVLATLRMGEGISQQELAGRLLVTKGNVCGVLDRMESGGWVERRPDPHDRRTNRLYLTDAGRALLADTLPEHHQVIWKTFGALKPAEVQGLYDLLDRLEEAAGD